MKILIYFADARRIDVVYGCKVVMSVWRWESILGLKYETISQVN